MKIMTILGTRPEIIRLSEVIPLLDRHADHVLVNTGQNYDPRLSDIFFEELGVRAPDEQMAVREPTMGAQIARILEHGERLLLAHRPDRMLILGDTNSGLIAIIARRLGIPVYHMEAGNRCYDDRSPEEVNRRVIDQCSTILLPYTERSRANLLGEGIPGHRIYVTGNPIKEIMDRHAGKVASSAVLSELGLEPGGFMLVTLHRAENVDDQSRLAALLEGLERLHRVYGQPIVCSLHPRTKARIASSGLVLSEAIRFCPPFGFSDFLKLEREAFCVLSDSGTVQEEACLLGVPNVTVRDVTERHETVECGSNVLAGTEPDSIVRAVALVTGRRGTWAAPPEYLRPNVADVVTRIVLSERLPDLAEVRWRAGREVVK